MCKNCINLWCCGPLSLLLIQLHVESLTIDMTERSPIVRVTPIKFFIVHFCASFFFRIDPSPCSSSPWWSDRAQYESSGTKVQL